MPGESSPGSFLLIMPCVAGSLGLSIRDWRKSRLTLNPMNR